MQLQANQTTPAISSMEIARLTGKTHRNVIRDIRVTLKAADIGLLNFESSYINSQNKKQPCYYLPRFECDLVVSGYSVAYRAAIIRRWHELEAATKAPSGEADHALWLIRQMMKVMPAVKLVSLVFPLHEYGSTGKNGQRRHGFRRPAFVAQEHRRHDAKEIHERTIVIKYLAQELGLETSN